MLLPFQGVNAMTIRNPGCRFACPGLGAVALSGRALAKSETCIRLFVELNQFFKQKRLSVKYDVSSNAILNT